jgi:hypothetical protein
MMKLLLSALLAGVLVTAPTSAEAKPARTKCTGVQTVEIRHGHKITRSYLACRQKRPVRPRPVFVLTNPWG